MTEGKILRYGQYLSTMRRHQRQVSFNEVFALERNMPKARRKLRLLDVHRLLTPYFASRLNEQLWAVVPLALMLVGFQLLGLRSMLDEGGQILMGIAAVILGLMCFMEGVKVGLMPFAESIGYTLPGRTTLLFVLAFGGLLGVAATFAEPAINALQLAGKSLRADDEQTLILRMLLGAKSGWLVLSIASGVGVAVIVGLLRYLYGWRMKTLIVATVPLCLGLTAYASTQPALEKLLGLAWDCGGITTGPVTVPLVLAVGLGVAASSGQGNGPLSGFGIITLASLFPVIAVISAGIFLDTQDVEMLAVLTVEASPAWYQLTPAAEIIGALRAILPLLLLLFLVQYGLLRQALKKQNVLIYGVLMALTGMAIFNLGLTTGLIELGNQAGVNVPWAFSPHRLTGEASLYPRFLGLTMTLVFAFCIGYGATIAEPALNAMGLTVENLTDGAFKKQKLVHAVALGVGLGAALGVAKILFGLPLAGLLLTCYGVALLLTFLSREAFVSLAWDSAGVTTGPVTVPLLLALGVGIAETVGASEGFGILALCSVGPIITVLTVGLWTDSRRNTWAIWRT